MQLGSNSTTWGEAESRTHQGDWAESRCRQKSNNFAQERIVEPCLPTGSGRFPMEPDENNISSE